MFAVTVTFSIASGQMSAFLPLMNENAATSLRDEPGCHRFDVATDPERPDQVFLYELYADPAAFRAHLSTPHFLRFDQQTAGMIAAKEVRTWARVGP